MGDRVLLDYVGVGTLPHPKRFPDGPGPSPSVGGVIGEAVPFFGWPRPPEPRRPILLDPDLQNALRRAIKPAVILHVAMLSEPVILVVVGVVLGQLGIFGNTHGLKSDIGFMHMIFIGTSALSFGFSFFFRRSMLSREKLIPSGADAMVVVGNYNRAQAVSNVCAVMPAPLGLVDFMMTGELTLLVVCAAIGVAMMMMTFPRLETLEAAAEAWLERGETLETEK